MTRVGFLAEPAGGAFPASPDTLVFISASPEETICLGEKLGRLLLPGNIVSLRGGLGAGKTYFAKGIARGLGVSGEITSPTYTILSEYEGVSSGNPLPLYHFDAYRLRGDDDFAALGGEEYLYSRGISVIEWGERIPASIPPEAILAEILITGGEKRRIRITAAPGLIKALGT